jgi:hypothetical protein
MFMVFSFSNKFAMGMLCNLHTAFRRNFEENAILHIKIPKKAGLSGKITTLSAPKHCPLGACVRIFPKEMSKKRGAQGTFFDAMTAEMFPVFAH